jgi:hypothetical protein
MIEAFFGPLVGGLFVGGVGRLVLGMGEDSGVAGSTAAGRRVVSNAGELISESFKPIHCWAWVWKAYERSGYTGAKYPTLKNVKVLFKGSQYTGSGAKWFPLSRYDELRPGDWIYIHNGNKYDTAGRGNHSGVFIKWLDRSNYIAQTASSRGKGKVGGYRRRDLRAMPIAWLMRPV